MLPINPSSAYTRTARFIREEWEAYFDADGCTPVTTVAGGWRGILYANLAIINPKASWEFFAQPNFDPSWLDGGASRTWYLAYAAGKLFGFISSFIFSTLVRDITPSAINQAPSLIFMLSLQRWEACKP